MLSFFATATLVLSSVHAYLWVKLRHLFSNSSGRMALLAFLVIMLGLLLLRSRELYAKLPDFVPWMAYTWLGFAIIAFGCFVAYDGLRIPLAIARFVSGKNLLPFFSPRTFTPVVLIIAVLISVYSMFEARNVNVKHVSINTDKHIGEVKQLRIVAVSDLHIGETIDAGDVAKWAELIKAEKPDILVVLGDIIDTDMSMRDAEAEILRGISTTYGTYAVMGNHEVYSGLENSREFIQRAGMILLENAADVSGPINIVGVNDPYVASFEGRRKPDVPALLFGLEQGRFTLLLKHQPIFQNGEAGLFDLQISGHTHGGQIWPGRLIVRKIFGFEQGLSLVPGGGGRSSLYLLNGTGYWGPPMRLLARPEITVFDLSLVDMTAGNI